MKQLQNPGNSQTSQECISYSTKKKKMMLSQYILYVSSFLPAKCMC